MEKLPKVTFVRSSTTEAVHFFALSADIYRNFYQENNIYILPYLKKKNKRCIYYPYLEHNIANFWDNTLKRHDKVINNSVILVSKVAKFFESSELDYSSLENGFRDLFSEVWRYFLDNMDYLFKDVSNIEIYPTSFGSECMRYSWFLEENSTIRLFPRIDAEVSETFKMMIYERLCRFGKKYPYEWSERIAISEFTVRNIYNRNGWKIGNKSFLFGTRDVKDGKLYEESLKYLQKLGFSFSSSLNCRQGNIFWNDKQLSLSKQECIVMELLIKNSGKIITYDEIGSAIWQNDFTNKFSLEAISQMVSRIRSKLDDNGVISDIVQNVQGKGYLLVNK